METATGHDLSRIRVHTGPTSGHIETRGEPLPPGVRAFFETRFGTDLATVRVHDSEEGARASRAIGARAFALGSDIAFVDGAYAPETEDGRRLLAHELTHAVQQREGGPAAIGTSAQPYTISQPDDPTEREADQVGAIVSTGGTAPPIATAPTLIARAPDMKGAKSLRDTLQDRYKIKILTGDRGWSDDDLKHLEWALSRLSGKEITAIAGYEFKRWTTPAARGKVDPAYDPAADTGEECGLHELDLATGKALISMYDDCFDPATTMLGAAIGRYNILHEIGHGIEVANARARERAAKALREKYDATYNAAKAAADAYNRSNDVRNDLITEVNAAEPAEQKRLQPKVSKAAAEADKLKTKADALDAATKALDKKLTDAETGRDTALAAPGIRFEQLTVGKDPLTEYSKTGKREAFAEAFALYKIAPKELEKTNKALHDWFKRQEELSDVTAPAAKKAKK